jgi:uncharacterized delta-60 repeat protein
MHHNLYSRLFSESLVFLNPSRLFPGRLPALSGLSFLAAVFISSAQPAPAAPGDLDSTFGIGGMVTSDFRRSNDIAYASALQADGKIIIAGIRFVGNSAQGGDFLVARYNSNGTLDRTFGQRGQVITDLGLTEQAAAVAVQPDGKILIAGGTYDLFPGSGGQYALVRYNSNGTLDTTFGLAGVVTTSFGTAGCFASAIVIQGDGKIVAAGTNYLDFSSNSDFAVARYNADGSLDSTFGGGFVSTDFNQGLDAALSVVLQGDGKIVAAGSAVSEASFYDFALVRYLADGTLDSTFGSGGKVETDLGANNLDQARAAVLQTDGKIVAAGTTVASNGLDQFFAITRYNSDGTLDNSFGRRGLATVDFGSFDQSARSVLLQTDGKIVAVGYADTESSDSDFLVARLNSNGRLDTTFGIGGTVRTSFGDLNGGANSSVLQPDGKIVAAGFNATPTSRGVDVALARYLGN